MHTTPEFDRTMTRFETLLSAGQDDTPEGHRAFSEVIRHAPPEFMELAGQIAREMDLIPTPAGLDAHGRPVYKLADVCEKLGATETEALEILAERGGDGLTTTPPVMRAH